MFWSLWLCDTNATENSSRHYHSRQVAPAQSVLMEWRLFVIKKSSNKQTEFRNFVQVWIKWSQRFQCGKPNMFQHLSSGACVESFKNTPFLHLSVTLVKYWMLFIQTVMKAGDVFKKIICIVMYIIILYLLGQIYHLTIQSTDAF